MAATAMLHVRIDEQIKTDATQALAAMGLSVSDAVRVFLMRVVAEQQLPFTLKVPNLETAQAMREADALVKSGGARFVSGAELLNDLDKDISQ
jgi:DNA-damage-inducible protein J